jgi:hypothetical protein
MCLVVNLPAVATKLSDHLHPNRLHNVRGIELGAKRVRELTANNGPEKRGVAVEQGFGRFDFPTSELIQQIVS